MFIEVLMFPYFPYPTGMFNEKPQSVELGNG